MVRSAFPRRRRRLRIGLGALPFLVAVALTGGQLPGAAAVGTGTQAATGVKGHAALAADGVSSPTLTFSDAAAQATLGNAYNLATTNLLTTNTVTYDPSTYNTSGLMQNPPGTFIRAGGGYSQPWTRDASVNSWNAASLLEPQVAENTLWSVVDKQSNGQLVLQQDNETWDEVVWMTAAWNQYLVTGDRTFLANAYQTATNTLALRESAAYNSSYGLFEGPAFFNDGIAGYPAPPADATESQGSYVGSYAATSTMMTLSTNELYYNAFRTTALMAGALGEPAATVSSFNNQAAALKTAINNDFWIPSKGMYGYFIHGADSMQGQLDQTEEGTGLSFAILFGIASPAQAQSIMQNTDIQPAGIVDTYPNFARYSTAQPGRHNVIVWPMVEGYWADAAAQSGDQTRFASEVESLASLADNANEFWEAYNAQTGVPDGGWQTGSHWSPAPDQTWSATAYLRMIYDDTFGMDFTTNGVTFQPTLPAGWGDVTLTGVQYRGATLNIALHGSGNVISAFKLDGTTTTNTTIPTTLTGTHSVDITLSNGQSNAVTGNAGLCLDVRGGATADLTPVQLYTCDGTNSQQWNVVTANNTLRSLGKCLDVDNGGTGDGTTVDLYTCNATGAQTWVPQSNGSLLNPQSGKCLDDPNSSTTAGTQLQLFDCNGTVAQTWVLPDTAAVVGYDGLCMDLRTGNTADGTAVQVYTCNGSNAQRWSVVPSNNTVELLGKCLDAAGGATTDGTLVDLYTCNGTGAQTWVPQSNGSLLNPQSGKCLDDPGYSTTAGTQLDIWDCNGGTNQHWTLPLTV
jgi:Ricin-type beta-trefoil lectin domain/Bacterial alpha-L-rhamnosidase 6 hairpin glycosidase domain